MTNEIKVFENQEFGSVRTVIIDEEPWFVGKDVAKALGYAKPENAIANHVSAEDKTSTLIQGSGSNYKSKTVIINESGLYALIFSSKLESAQKFKRWVTSEVLPDIRKHETKDNNLLETYVKKNEIVPYNNKNIQMFSNTNFGNIRVVMNNNEPWFVLKDVCEILHLESSHKVADRLDFDERNQIPLIDSLGREQKTTIISESGLYNVIIRSDKPQAKPFRKWVTSEVLPDIRKHGMYMTENTVQSILQNPRQMAEVLIAYAEEKDKNKALVAENEALKPKATYCDMVLQAPTAVPISIIAKDYGMSATQMNKLLHDFHVQYKVNGTWLLYQEYADCGYVKTSSHVYEKNDGSTDCKVYTKWTQAGRMFIYKVLKANNIHPIME